MTEDIIASKQLTSCRVVYLLKLHRFKMSALVQAIDIPMSGLGIEKAEVFSAVKTVDPIRLEVLMPMDDSSVTDSIKSATSTKSNRSSKSSKRSHDDKITIVVLRRNGLADTTGAKFESGVSAHATLADIRAVLTDDEIMKEGDKFYINGSKLGKSAESAKRYAELRLKVSIHA